MKQLYCLLSGLLLFGLIVPIAVFSHPYEGAPHNAPRTFLLHVTEDGRPVYTNIPKQCFSNGVLLCSGLHPLFGGTGTVKNPGNDL